MPDAAPSRSDHKRLLSRYVENGDEAAFESLVDEFKGLVFSTALRRLGSPQLAEEVTQTVFSIVVRKARALQNVDNLAAWMHRTATRVASQTARTESRHRRKMKALLDENETHSINNDDWGAIHPHLDEALERLAKRDRQIVMLRYYDRLSFREIASQLGKSEAAAQRQGHRAIEKLAHSLKRKGAATATVAILTAGLAAQFTAPVGAALATSPLAHAAIASAPSIGGATIISNTFHTMSQIKTASITTAVLIAACIPLALQRSAISQEKRKLVAIGQTLTTQTDPTLAGSVREAWKMASLLRKNRFANGALDLEMSEIKIKLDENGRAAECVPVTHTESHQLVEECMLIANQSVAKVLRERSKPSLYRIHEDPDPSRLADYTETAKQYGYQPGDLSNRAHIQALLDESKGSAEEHTIKLGLLKSLKRAAYSADPLGHYGLAKTDYCHFTSPIRRYADLIVHRSLQPFLQNPPKSPSKTPSQAELREIANHISTTERNSSEAESETKQIKLLEYLDLVALTDQALDEEDGTKFPGVITDVRAMGLMVEIPDMGVRGVVKREELPRGTNWRFEMHNAAWTSSDGRRLALGMKLPLRIVAIDKVKRFVDFAVAGAPTTEGVKPTGGSGGGGKSSSGRRAPKSNTRGSSSRSTTKGKARKSSKRTSRKR